MPATSEDGSSDGSRIQRKSEDVAPFQRRLLFAFAAIICFLLVLAARLAWLQIINKNDYVERAEKNRTERITTQGSRGLIVDRNGQLIAGNIQNYTLEITPDKAGNINKTIDSLSKIIRITDADKRRFKRLREDLNRYDSIPIRSDLSPEEIAVFTGQRWRFPGVEVNQRASRIYPQKIQEAI